MKSLNRTTRYIVTFALLSTLLQGPAAIHAGERTVIASAPGMQSIAQTGEAGESDAGTPEEYSDVSEADGNVPDDIGDDSFTSPQDAGSMAGEQNGEQADAAADGVRDSHRERRRAKNPDVNASGKRNRSLAVDPTATGEGFTSVLYNNTNGLPTSEANAIAETSEGFIWIGSYSGLIRYDGNTFVRMDSSTGISSVVSLYTDSKDRLWIGTNDSGVTMMERNTFTRWGKAEGFKSSYIYSIAEDRAGNMYIATAEGLMVIDSSLELQTFGDPLVDNAHVEELRVGNDGTIYGINVDGDLFAIKDRKIVSYLSHDENAAKGAMSFLPDPDRDGYMYLGTENQILYGNYNDGFAEVKSYDIAPLSYVECFEKVGNQIWFCSGNGVGVIENGSFHLLENVPMNNSVGHMMTDYEGNLWFTSTRQGVMKIAPNRFADIYKRYDLPEAVVNSTCTFGDQLFIGTDTGLTVIGPDGPVSELPLENASTVSGKNLEAADLLKMLDGCRIRSIIRDSKSRLWISTWRMYGLLCYDGKSVKAYNVEDGLLSDRVRTVCERDDGTLLVANAGGVTIIDDAQVIRSYSEGDGIVNMETLSVADGPDGDILVGTDGGGIYIVGRDGVRNLGIEDGLSSEIVMRIKKDRIRDLYWLITSNSIAFMTPDYKVTTVENFPYTNNFDLYENSLGDIWVFSSNGIYVVPAEELLANDQVEPVFYGTSNGLPCIPTANSYSELTDDGELYISGSTGVARVNVDDAYGKVSDLKAAIPYIEADDVRIYPQKNGVFNVPSRVRKMTVYSYVYNYSLIDPLVSCQLEGFDRKSITVNRSEMVPLSYTNLPGGSYKFTIKVMDSMGRGNKTISIPIVKEKAFYEQFWFYIILGVLAISALAFCVDLYVKKRMHLLELKHQEEAEKERITTELKMANKIQESMLPNTFPPYPDRTEFDIYASMEPAKEVGGDFYDFYLIDDDHLGIVIADVSGKGVPASLVMMITKAIIKSYAMLGATASEILTNTNESLCASNKMEMFVTAWFGILEISTGKITASNAGHEYPAVYSAKEGSFSLVRDKHNFVLGGMEGIPYKGYELWLQPGDKLFVYTDGVAEATDRNNELFGTERMIAALNTHPAADPGGILGAVHEAVDVFVGEAEQFDDLTMLCLEYKGPGRTDKTEQK